MIVSPLVAWHEMEDMWHELRDIVVHSLSRSTSYARQVVLSNKTEFRHMLELQSAISDV